MVMQGTHPYIGPKSLNTGPKLSSLHQCHCTDKEKISTTDQIAWIVCMQSSVKTLDQDKMNSGQISTKCILNPVGFQPSVCNLCIRKGEVELTFPSKVNSSKKYVKGWMRQVAEEACTMQLMKVPRSCLTSSTANSWVQMQQFPAHEKSPFYVIHGCKDGIQTEGTRTQ